MGLRDYLRAFLLTTLVIILSSCGNDQKSKTRLQAEKYFQLYADRTDWQGFVNQYAEDLVFQDVVYGLSFDKVQFIKFYNWPDTSFHKHPDYPKTLILEDLAVTDSSAVGRGYFTPFYFGGQLMAMEHRWRFTIWLYFNEEGKVHKHIDYIDYPARFMKSAAEGRMKNTN